MKHMTSHCYAQKLTYLADFLSSKPDFALPFIDQTMYFFYRHDRKGLLTAAEALGPGSKRWDDDLSYVPDGSPESLRLHFCAKAEAAPEEVVTAPVVEGF